MKHFSQDLSITNLFNTPRLSDFPCKGIYQLQSSYSRHFSTTLLRRLGIVGAVVVAIAVAVSVAIVLVVGILLRVGWGHTPCRLPHPLDLSVHGRNHVHHPDHCRNNGVDDVLPVVDVAGQFQSKSAVDDSQGDEGTTKPQVKVRPESATTVLLEKNVVQPSKDWLEEEENKDHNANDGVGFLQLRIVSSVFRTTRLILT